MANLKPYAPPSNPKPVLSDDSLYSGDNGRITCGLHAGTSARFTGRSISGQQVAKITPAFVRGWPADLGPVQCEDCGHAFGAKRASP